MANMMLRRVKSCVGYVANRLRVRGGWSLEIIQSTVKCSILRAAERRRQQQIVLVTETPICTWLCDIY